MEAKYVNEITVIDPDTKGEVQLAVYKHENGGMFAMDLFYLEQVADESEDCYNIIDPFGPKPDILKLID